MNFGHGDIFSGGEHFHGYVIERLLGNGSLGAVYLVRHELLGTLFALKVLFPEFATANESYVKRFLREARIAMQIRHPNIVAVYDCGFDKERQLYYLVMDYVKGGDLRQAIAFAGHFSPDRAVEVVLQVASALELANRHHIVHRDIKPENIMIQPDGLVKLVDLGIAKADDLGDNVQTTTNSVFGTPSYIAPEQALDASSVDTRADIYSLGVVLFEMIAGKPPFDGPNPPQILAQTLSEDPFPDIRDCCKEINPMLAALIRRMCVKEKERRISDPHTLLKEFEKLGYSLNTPASPASRGYATNAENMPTVRSLHEMFKKLPDDVIHATPEVNALLKRWHSRKKIMTAAIIAALAIVAIAIAILI